LFAQLDEVYWTADRVAKVAKQEQVSGRMFDSHLVVGRDDETAFPLIDGLGCKKRSNALYQCVPTGVSETHQQQPCVRSGSVEAHIRKVEILRDQKTVAGLSGSPDFLVGLPYEAFRSYRVNVVPQLA